MTVLSTVPEKIKQQMIGHSGCLVGAGMEQKRAASEGTACIAVRDSTHDVCGSWPGPGKTVGPTDASLDG